VKGTFGKADTRRSKLRSKNAEYWEIELWEARFVTILECRRKGCGEIVTVAGHARAEEYYDEEYENAEHEIYLVPDAVNPAPRMIALPEATPEAVRAQLEAAFLLYWLDPSASGSRVRTAVEQLLDALKIPRKKKTKEGRFRRLSLHGRIEKFREKSPDLGDALLALKWLGNVATHDTTLSRDDVLDALELVEHVLDEVFKKSRDRLREIARSINKHKGRRPRTP